MIEMVPEAQIDELIRLADLQGIDPYAVPDKDLGSLKGVGTVFYTTGVINSPGQISSYFYRLRSRLQSLARESLRPEAAYKLKQIEGLASLH